MSMRTRINHFEFTISSDVDGSMRGLRFSRNRKIDFLPVYIADQFPNLEALAAEECWIKSISEQSFDNLVQLRELTLQRNQIAQVSRDVFADLISLEWLDLREFL